ncbi:MAG: hypothetical protein KF696_10090 [Planctomycetes bacterium]|nr:hypothetical protein [Planctomycetota bacterium]MCW8136207.1 hypothetical protein [Planctomycetota bacterium]
MTKAFNVFAIFVILLAVAACGGGDNKSSGGGGSGGSGGGGPDMSTPAGTLKEMSAAFEAGDIERILKCYDKDYLAKKEGDRTVEEKFRAEFKEIKDGGGYLKWTFNEADIKIDGDKAGCKGKMKIKPSKDDPEQEEDESVTLVKKDGKWWCDK